MRFFSDYNRSIVLFAWPFRWKFAVKGITLLNFCCFFSSLVVMENINLQFWVSSVFIFRQLFLLAFHRWKEVAEMSGYCFFVREHLAWEKRFPNLCAHNSPWPLMTLEVLLFLFFFFSLDQNESFFSGFSHSSNTFILTIKWINVLFLMDTKLKVD